MPHQKNKMKKIKQDISTLIKGETYNGRSGSMRLGKWWKINKFRHHETGYDGKYELNFDVLAELCYYPGVDTSIETVLRNLKTIFQIGIEDIEKLERKLTRTKKESK